jgi:hypothetical protein
MSAAPFDARLIVTRLKAQVQQLRLVGLGADYAAIRSLADFPVPCSYVLLATENGAPQPPGHAPAGQVARVRQMVEVVFGVATAVRNYREDRGDSLADELGVVVGATRGSLIGYVPPLPGARAIQWVSGRIEDYDASTALWVDIFKTQHAIGSATP